MKIITLYWAKPIPTRAFDWEATLEDYEPGYPIGYGYTEEEAIANLKEEIDEHIHPRRH
jgi:hypothetical protein